MVVSWRKKIYSCPGTQEPQSPNFLRTISAGQNPVNADCSRLKPTKAESQTQFGFTNCVRMSPVRMRVPARARMIFSSFMIWLVDLELTNGGVRAYLRQTI